VALLLGMSVGVHDAYAQESMPRGPSTKGFLSCAKKCQKSFYFSEQSDPTFAGLRNACIEGCGSVVDANMSAYQSCTIGCQGIFTLPTRYQCRVRGISKDLYCRLSSGPVSEPGRERHR